MPTITPPDRLGAWITLHLLPHWGPVTLARLLEETDGDPQAVFELSEKELLGQIGVGPQMAHVLHHWRDYCDPEAERTELEKVGGYYLTWDDPHFPADLRTLHDAPILLTAIGRPPPFPPGVALVGTRTPSQYGRRQTADFARDLARAGVCVLSGLARGVDAVAHEACLDAGGHTVAVLGSGLFRFFPPECQPLYERIAAEGTVLSEFPLYRQADRQTFPIRNRIVSGLSRGVLVVESKEKGGSMITATFAARQGRQVYALPGRVDQPLSAGCHQLIRDGAQLVTSARDIIEDLELGRQIPLFPEAAGPEVIQPSAENKAYATILQALREGDTFNTEELTEQTGFPASRLASLLVEMELEGLLQRDWEGRYEKA
jgi:DNA processing protein